ncbi:MAG: hypothetical protein VX613_03230, partial [Candidatus Thermoplasmatota archaeon]|nr:hypothetical protein [Candidatus Thermoplasmatota archaeon]
MVEPERVLHSVMVIAFERKGVIDQNLKIIKAVQDELNLTDDDKFDALEHIKKFRGNGDWSGKRDAVVSVAIERIEDAIEDNLIQSSSITNALTKLINVTLNEQKPSNNTPSNDPLAAFEEDEEEMPDTSLKFGLEDEEEEEIVPVELIETEDEVEEFENDSIVSQEAFSLEDSEDDIEEVDDEEVDPFDLIGGRGNTNSGNGGGAYRD